MIKGIYFGAYYFKGKFHDIDTCATRQARDEITDIQALNKVLESHEKTLSALIGKVLVKEFKPEKKVVYFVQWEGDYLESAGGSIKNQSEFTCVKTDWTPASFIKESRRLAKEDAKALAKPDKVEEDYI